MEKIINYFKKLYKQLTVSYYYSENGCPIKCWNCKSIIIDEITKESINYVTCECSLVCHNCQTELGYYAYGFYDPNYRKNYIEGYNNV